MKHRHIILEGKPTTGKTEVSNLFKIYFPRQVRILPELVTVLVRENGLTVMEHRREHTDLLLDAVPARAAEVKEILEKDPDVVVFEESHMGVHWAYSTVANDRTFLDVYEEKIAPSILEPDIYLRFNIPVALSVQRQVARATKDVEVSGALVRQAFANVDKWHADRGHDNVVVVNTNRSPAVVIADVMEVMGLEYEIFAE
jgi:thymidylate kinase